MHSELGLRSEIKFASMKPVPKRNLALFGNFISLAAWSSTRGRGLKISNYICAAQPTIVPNPALNLAPSGRWTLRMKPRKAG
jgi:hypothetical protein